MSGEVVSPPKKDTAIHLSHYSDFKETLKRLIINSFHVGQKIPSIEHLVRHFAVDVRKVRQSLSELIQEGFLGTEDNSSFFVSSQILAQDTKIVGVFISEPIEIVTWSIYHQIISAIQDEFNNQNIRLIQVNFKYDFEEAFRLSKLFLQKKVAGIIFQCISSEEDYSRNKKLIELFERQRIPVILIDKYFINEPENYSFVVSDNEQGGFLATRHLIQLGYDQIAYVRDAYSSSAILREKGYRKALINYGIRPREELIKVFHSLEELKKGLDELFVASVQRPQAILTINDLTASQLYPYLAKLGLRIPDDVAVVGFDDLPNSTQLKPPLTSVRQNFTELGQRTAQYLLKRINNFTTLPQSTLPCELIVRESCGAKKRQAPVPREKVTIPILNDSGKAETESISTKSPHKLGVIFRGFEDEPYLQNYYSRIIKGITNEARSKNYEIVLSAPFKDRSSENVALNALVRQGIQGLIFVATYDRFPPAQDELVFLFRRKIPFISLSHSDIAQISTVTIDDRYGSYLAMKYLIEANKHTIGVILSRSGDAIGAIRLRGIHDAVNELCFNLQNLIVFQNVLKSGFTHQESAYLWSKELNLTDYPLEGLICFNDAVAQGAIQALRERNISIPDQISVVGFDDGIDCTTETINLPLTTVHVPGHELGREAMRQVVEQIASPLQTLKVNIKPRLIIRQSS